MTESAQGEAPESSAAISQGCLRVGAGGQSGQVGAMLENMTSTPEPDDRPAAADQTADPVSDQGAEDTVAGTAGDRPDDATAATSSDRPADVADGVANDRPDGVASGVANDRPDDVASGADRAEEGAPSADSGARDGATRAMEPSGEPTIDEAPDAADAASQDADAPKDTPVDAEAAARRGPDPVDAGSARTEATGAGDTRPFGASGAGDTGPFGAPGAATAGGPPPWTSAAAGSGGGSVPPWASYRPPPAPPGTSGFATRYGLVRPVHNRYIAGVCGAFARATNTDPVLWRVALPVLTVLGGFGILVYLLGWLLIPAEGDTASPVESLLRHGRSSTSKLVTVVLGIISAAWIVGTFSSGIGWKIVVAAAIVGAVVVIGGARGGNAPRWSTRPVEPQPGTDPYGYGWYAASGQTAAGAPPAGASAAGVPVAGASVAGAPMGTATGGWPVDPVATATGTGWPESTAWHSAPAEPGTRAGTDPLTNATLDPAAADGAMFTDEAGWQPSAYRPPFAPGGPYAQSDPYAPTAPFTNLYDDPAYATEFPGLTPGASTPPPATPPAQRRRSTVARRITLFATVLVVGLLGILDATNVVPVPAPAYFAAALATVGLGLVIGSMFGRVRGPIFLGIVLAIGLVVTSVTSAYHGGQLTIRPTNFAELPTTYQGSVGQVTVDLRKLDFNGQIRTIDLRLSAGQILVELPPNVDAHVRARVGAGDTLLFGEHPSSGARARADVTNNGADGPGGGQITIDAKIAFAGLVEVKR
jgi:phage shock protein PspC (stress-responsive transcriptional regulator)